MRRPVLIALVLSLILACTGGDPKSSRLSMGQTAIAFGTYPKAEHIVFKSTGAKPVGPLAEPGLSVIAVGSKLRVVTDDEPSPNAGTDDRPVKVIVLEGLQEGVTGTVYRDAIRPAP